MSMELPPELQNQIAQYQQIQQQLQLISSQKVQVDARLEEIETTLEEIEKLEEETPMYKLAGSLLVKVTDKDTLKEELEENQETTSIKSKSLERQEKQLKEKFIELQQSLTQAMQGMNRPQSS